MILVTGGTGLVGSHLLSALVKEGKNVRALIRSNSKTDNVKSIFAIHHKNANELFNQIYWKVGDVLDVYSLLDAMKDVTEVYHCAAMVSFNSSLKKEMYNVNVKGTANMVNAALEMNIRKFCHVSSIATLGRAGNLGITDENTSWKNSESTSWYSITKFEAENEVWRGIEEGLNAVIVNPSVIIGKGDWHGGGSSGFFPLVYNGLKFYTEGTNGFVDVRDVANAMRMLVDSDICNERFILSSENLSYKQLFDLIAYNLKCKSPSIHAKRFLCEASWRLEKLRSLLMHREPLITRETMQTSTRMYRYSNEKIKSRLPVEFIPIADSVRDTAQQFLNDFKNTGNRF